MLSGRERRMASELHEVEQILGSALGYPLYSDDQETFPGATPTDGVCTGEHTAASLAMEAATVINSMRDALRKAAQSNEQL